MHVEPYLIEPQRAGDRRHVLRLLAGEGASTDELADGTQVDFLVMREAGDIVGAVGLQTAAGEGLLRSLVVAPDFRGHGRGSALVMALERLAAGRGIEELFVLTTTAPKFFALLDYWRVERAAVPAALQALPQFRSLCPRDAIVMRKRLTRSSATR